MIRPRRRFIVIDYDSNRPIHVIPQNDMREHIPRLSCWCKPTPDEKDPQVILHHSMDRREEFEPDADNKREPS